jgi:exopolyphosphatase/guanosine-5'-triphosphate,3'-diphosphate pyrophosphatase
MTDRPSVGASVDLGSNSVHLLVASIAGHQLRPIVDESVFLGLGAAVDERGHLGRAARTELATTVDRYVTTARRLGAATITIMGTEPIRRAADAARIVGDVNATSRVPLHVLSHEEEAYLTLVGVTEGLPVEHETLVVDIGGGSSEFCAVAPGGTARAAGVRLGSNRLTSAFVNHDPPTGDELASMTLAADEVLRDALPATPRTVVVVGGTASNLLKVAPSGSDDRRLSRSRLRDAVTGLLGHTAASTAERFGVNQTRARILPAGAAIVDALMRRYGMDHVDVSEAGIREGAILVAEHIGATWRDRLPELAHGWRTEQADAVPAAS